MFISEEAVNSENVRDELDQALKAELPPRFRETLRSVQALERYSLHRDEYEEPLARALAEYIKKPEPAPREEDKRLEREAFPPPANVRPDVLPKIVFFALMLSAGACLFLIFVMILIPYFTSPFPGGPFNNHLAGLVTGLFFSPVAVGLGAGALAVYRVYLQRKDG